MSAAQNAATYADCVASLRNSLTYLQSSVETLDQGVSDLPRVASVLRPTRHFELIPQPTLAAAEASLRDEIGPYISLLLDRADAQIARRERRIETLKARCELLQGRLSQPKDGDDEDGYAKKKSKGVGARGKALNGERALRARAVRQRREGLEYSVERLELEVLSKERELRKRLEKA
ncbi:DASH complex subunit spc19 [Colletotrichum siamense]|uniref:DASH complex subunit SPC19 n=1 Tax=Colletotrichum siamense TaxID=690259 RepID=A0A9P5F0W1_COLSI|nr:DASH complex subunit spc19 [Colletotrichum siamense]KAI8238510.1 DASH complex subunit spc19 [Colletotrichum sp. SAR 10_96]KAI8295060.1 DASH complex subunit spc19 [Colletotrichum sp. SAR 10_98]KAJ5014746.1 DASH complex subunit spc19 [Colletotrichum sp. SAR 10_99]KAF4849536.1 DASH complex subunit spc19 [Colletotrichum siamense]